jgi:hypothetical protein
MAVGIFDPRNRGETQKMSNQQKLDHAVEAPNENAPAASDPKLDNAAKVPDSVISTFDGATTFDGSAKFDG